MFWLIRVNLVPGTDMLTIPDSHMPGSAWDLGAQSTGLCLAYKQQFGVKWLVDSRTTYLLDDTVFPSCGLSGRKMLFSKIYSFYHFIFINFFPAVQVAGDISNT